MNKNFKNILTTTLCVFLCGVLLTGCSNNTNAKAKAQTLDVQGIPVYVEPDDNTLQRQIDFMINNIKKQPDYLLKNCHGIHLQAEKSYKDTIENSENKDKLINSIGLATSVNNNIYLNIEDIDPMNIEKVATTGTITHELWHVYDYTHGTYNLDSSQTPEFMALYNAAPNSISDYGSTDSYEFFAEAGEMYVNSPNKLKKANIDVYNYFEALPKD